MSFKEWKAKLGGKAEELFAYGPGAGEEEIKRTKKHIYYLFIGIIIFILVMGAIVLGGLSLFSNRDSSQEKIQAEKVYINISKGMSSGEIGDLLLTKGVIDSGLKFRIMTKLNGAEGSFQAGRFIMYKGMEENEALETLLHGRAEEIRITIPEGKNIREIANIFADVGMVSREEFLELAKSYKPYDYIRSGENVNYALEGFLFPDTYAFEVEATSQDIIDKMLKEFDKRLSEDLRKRAEERGMDIYQLITLASLVEKEALYPEDRPIIAQVFLKRLEIGMPLQSDTTLQYLMDAPKEDVLIEDTKIESPYNTYQNYGLPPGPIASPGMASIEAVLYPADTDYLYFVADRQGHNHYSHSYEEHLSIVGQVR